MAWKPNGVGIDDARGTHWAVLAGIAAASASARTLSAALRAFAGYHVRELVPQVNPSVLRLAATLRLD